MAGTVDLQSLLRFLTKDAKLPLATAMSKVKDLQQAQLTSPETISKSTLPVIQAVFPDLKTAKAVLNAAKRLSKKRGPDEGPQSSAITSSSSAKRRRTSLDGLLAQTPSELEASLSLPTCSLSTERLTEVTLIINRAPFLLAMAYTTLCFTMPSQPASAKLSLAQAVVSAGAKAKAASIGLSRGSGGEGVDLAGLPSVRVMSRDIQVMRRWGYEYAPMSIEKHDDGEAMKQESTNPDIGGIVARVPGTEAEDEPPLWALDPSQLSKLTGAPTFTSADHTSGLCGDLPVYAPQPAQAYLLRSFESPVPSIQPEHTDQNPTTSSATPAPKAKAAKQTKSKAMLAAEKEENLAALLRALHLLFASWAVGLSSRELDLKAWSWYLKLRPDVQDGVQGWGAKGEVRLSDVLALRKDGGIVLPPKKEIKEEN